MDGGGSRVASGAKNWGYFPLNSIIKTNGWTFLCVTKTRCIAAFQCLHGREERSHLHGEAPPLASWWRPWDWPEESGTGLAAPAGVLLATTHFEWNHPRPDGYRLGSVPGRKSRQQTWRRLSFWPENLVIYDWSVDDQCIQWLGWNADIRCAGRHRFASSGQAKSRPPERLQPMDAPRSRFLIKRRLGVKIAADQLCLATVEMNVGRFDKTHDSRRKWMMIRL